MLQRLKRADQLALIYRNNGNAQESVSGQAPERPPLFSNLAPVDYERIIAGARVKDFTRGQMLYVEGDPVQQILLLTSGLVKITKFGMAGMEVILRLGVPGDVLGALGLFVTGKQSTTVQAFRSCQVLIWDAQTFKSLVERYPVLHVNMIQVLSEYLGELEDRFREVATERVGARVALQLVRLQKQIGQSVDGVVEIGISREQLAQMTGTTLFTVSRLLSSWEAMGIVKPLREAVVIRDLESLRAMSEG